MRRGLFPWPGKMPSETPLLEVGTSLPFESWAVAICRPHMFKQLRSGQGRWNTWFGIQFVSWRWARHLPRLRNGNEQVCGTKAELQFEATLGGKVWRRLRDSDHCRSTQLAGGHVSRAVVREPWCVLVERMPQPIGSHFQVVPLWKWSSGQSCSVLSWSQTSTLNLYTALAWMTPGGICNVVWV